MLHILVGDSSTDPELLLNAAKSGKLRQGVVPKTAAIGDPALFFVRPEGFVARGIIQSRPAPHPNWPGRYGASIHSLSVLPAPMPPAFVRDNMPEWGWPHARTLGYTSITGHTESKLEELLDSYEAQFTEPASVTSTALTEGAANLVLVTAYERNPVARQQCIQHYGPECIVCGFSFEETFGEQAAGYIHVHHIEAVFARGGTYEVDPVRDLRPICPNCHAVAHLRRPPYSIADVKAMRKHA